MEAGARSTPYSTGCTIRRFLSRCQAGNPSVKRDTDVDPLRSVHDAGSRRRRRCRDSGAASAAGCRICRRQATGRPQKTGNANGWIISHPMRLARRYCRFVGWRRHSGRGMPRQRVMLDPGRFWYEFYAPHPLCLSAMAERSRSRFGKTVIIWLRFRHSGGCYRAAPEGGKGGEY